MVTFRLGPYFAVVGKEEEWGLKPNTTGHEKAMPQFLAFNELELEELAGYASDAEEGALPDPLPVELWKAPPTPRKE